MKKGPGFSPLFATVHYRLYWANVGIGPTNHYVRPGAELVTFGPLQVDLDHSRELVVVH